MTAVTTQGRQDEDQWVTSYKICYSQKLDGYCELLDQVLLFLGKIQAIDRGLFSCLHSLI